jgi:hypothetical protein
MLIRLLYASRTAEDISQSLLEVILSQSRQNNPEQGVTGVLCVGGRTFMQVLEGGRETVNALYRKIAKDPRHHDAGILHYEEVDERRFGGWTMGHVNLDRISPNIILKYSDSTTLDPFKMRGRSALALLDELMLSAAVVGRSDSPRVSR